MIAVIQKLKKEILHVKLRFTRRSGAIFKTRREKFGGFTRGEQETKRNRKRNTKNI